MTEAERRRLCALLAKYRALEQMRVRFEPEQRLARPAMRALAARFPGALRELDESPLELIVTRSREIEATLSASRAPSLWMQLQCDYHGLLRAALRRRCGLRPGQAGQAAVACEALDARQGADPWVDELDADDHFAAEFEQLAASGTSGSLNAWAFERVAARHGVRSVDVELALFVRPTRQRRGAHAP